ncbi:hypothetical protein [Haloterrigena salinisoli]|uniref:hypothetical protein n=1 Tax=Haloterrigena salinisoli TaxID=3132747 RepID=UPI0030CBBB50
MTVSRRVKVSIVGLSGIFSLAVLGYHHTSQFWPSWPLAGGLSALVLVYLIVSKIHRVQHHVVPTLVLVVAFGIAYRAGLFALPPSLMYIDPQAYAVQTQWILETGSIDELSIGFYDSAALFTTFGAMAAELLGTSPRHAFIIFPIAIGAIIPLVTFIITRRVRFSGQGAALLAALLSTLAFGSIHFATTPRPYTLSLPFFAAAIFLSIHYLSSSSKRVLVLLGVLGFAMAVTHKLPLVVFVAVLFITFSYLSVVRNDAVTNRRGWRLAGFASTLLALQWLFITDYFQSVFEIGVSTVIALLTGQTGIGSSSNPTHAVPATPSLIGRALHHMELLLYLAAFISGLVLCWRLYKSERSDYVLVTVLSGTAILGVFVGLGIMTPIVGGFLRPLLFGELFFAISVSLVVAPHLIALREQFGTRSVRTIARSGIIVGILCLVLLAQFGAAGLVPDHPDRTRLVLTEGEVEGQSWEAKYIEGPAYSDPYYADFVSNPEHAVSQGREYEMKTVSQPYDPGVIQDRELFNATLLNQDYRYFAYRTNVEVYSLGGYRLTWDLQEALKQKYNKVYANGDVEMYHNESR